jgi:hypothetical protein
MKILYCKRCHDLFPVATNPRNCLCGQSTGARIKDSKTVCVAGPCRVFGGSEEAFVAASVLTIHCIDDADSVKRLECWKPQPKGEAPCPTTTED